jgi:hypothetical protein
MSRPHGQSKREVSRVRGIRRAVTPGRSDGELGRLWQSGTPTRRQAGTAAGAIRQIVGGGEGVELCDVVSWRDRLDVIPSNLDRSRARSGRRGLCGCHTKLACTVSVFDIDRGPLRT